jgi:2-polyprenyl-3-methyl-5-hydroxy-6-metoxy-1,4-benzoquinol methylase
MRCKICGGTSKLFYDGLFDDRHGYPDTFDLYQCGECGFGQLDIESKNLDFGSLYTKYYPRKSYSPERVILEVELGSKFKDAVFGRKSECHKYVSTGMTLDIGCGAGHSLLYLRNKGLVAVGTELDENVLDIAAPLGITIHLGTLEQSTLPKRSFDNVTATQVLEHVESPLDFIASAKEYVRPSGTLYLSFPNFGSLTRRLARRQWLHYHVPYHVNFFTQRSIQIAAERCRLRIDRLFTVTPVDWLSKQVLNVLADPVPGKKDQYWENPAPTRLLNIALVPAAKVLDILKLGDSFVLSAGGL